VLKERIKDMLTYIKDSYNELLNKVSWPSMDDLLKSTVVVIVASAIFGILVLLMDQSSLGFMNLIYEMIS
jgi:preprotein translocase subunit SecE